MKIRKSFIGGLILVFVAVGFGFGLDWPQEEKGPDSIVSFFGQNIGGKISKSIIFTDPAQVNAIKDGTLLIVMSDVDDDSDFFPSSLGSCVILSHADDMISVYANLDEDSINLKKNSYTEGELIGETGNSGWQQTRSSLEFQLLDNQKSAAINPKILLPRIENEKDYNLSGIMLQNKEGKFFDIKETKIFPSGTYKIYHTRNKTIVPYKTTCTINGVIIDEICFDTINMLNGRLYIDGSTKQYTADILYPDQNLILTGEVMFPSGQSTLGITVENYLGKTKQISYILSIY